MKTIFALLLSLIFIPTFSQNSPVENLLRRIDSVYANANTYRDHGEAGYTLKGLFLPNCSHRRIDGHQPYGTTVADAGQHWR